MEQVMKRCANCNQEYDDVLDACPHCAKRMPQKRSNRPFKIVIWVLLFGLLLMLIGGTTGISAMIIIGGAMSGLCFWILVILVLGGVFQSLVMKSNIGNAKVKQAVGSAWTKVICGVLLTWLVGGLALPRLFKFRPPVAGKYSHTFNTSTQLNGVIVVGWVSFYSPSKNVEFATLATDQVAWGKTPLPAGTGIHFTPEGKPEWCFLAKNSEIKGHIFRKGQSWMTEFYPDGEMESGGLVNVEVIDGIPCEAAAESLWHIQPRTHFYKDGKLKSAVVAYTFRYRGQIIKKGEQIELKPDGSFFLATNNPFVGTWKLNVEKSKFPNPAPKSSTITFMPIENGTRFMQEIVDSQGKIQQLRAMEWWDEKERDSRFPGETSICSRIDSNTVVLVFKKDGKETRRVTEAISNSGRILIRTSIDKDAQGNDLENIAVFEKQ